MKCAEMINLLVAHQSQFESHNEEWLANYRKYLGRQRKWYLEELVARMGLA